MLNSSSHPNQHVNCLLALSLIKFPSQEISLGSSVAERHLGKMEVVGPIPTLGSLPHSLYNILNTLLLGCRSGQSERSVKPSARAYGGSNPPPSTGIKNDH